VFNIFSGKGVPLKEDLDALRAITERENYSHILNYSPFISKKDLKHSNAVVQMYIPLASLLVRMCNESEKVRHLSLAVHSLMNTLIAPVARSRNGNRASKENGLPFLPQYKGNSICLTQEDIDQADKFLINNNLMFLNHLVFLNPDAAIRFTQIPVSLQIRILRKLAESDHIDGILMGTGRVFKGVEYILRDSLPDSLRSKVVIVPPIPAGMYAALLDRCDVFLSSDTGPVHIAAAMKVSASSYAYLRNRTSVVTVFGSGDSKIYGYDSQKQGHIAANQEAPSRAFIANAPCRNITCANKWGKTCKEIRCFAGLRADDIADYILTYVRTLCESEEHVFEPNIH
jgi:hypothetical protein